MPMRAMRRLVDAVVEQVFETALLQDGIASRSLEHGRSTDFADAGGDRLGRGRFALRRFQDSHQRTGC